MSAPNSREIENPYNGHAQALFFKYCRDYGELATMAIKAGFPAPKDPLHQDLQKARAEAQEEYKQFVLNVLDGVDIADGQCNTKAIRFALQSRIIQSELDQLNK
jgi:hypothetical protein